MIRATPRVAALLQQHGKEIVPIRPGGCPSDDTMFVAVGPPVTDCTSRTCTERGVP